MPIAPRFGLARPALHGAPCVAPVTGGRQSAAYAADSAFQALAQTCKIAWRPCASSRGSTGRLPACWGIPQVCRQPVQPWCAVPKAQQRSCSAAAAPLQPAAAVAGTAAVGGSLAAPGPMRPHPEPSCAPSFVQTICNHGTLSSRTVAACGGSPAAAAGAGPLRRPG